MKPLIVGNWKLNPTSQKKAKQLFLVIKKGAGQVKGSEAVICPPFVYLSILENKSSKIKLGAQNCFWEEQGAFTGETSVSMLRNLGCKYVILGHSERRQYFKEKNLGINKKIKAVLDKGLTPILCVGETGKEKNTGKTQKVIKEELEKGLRGVSRAKAKEVIIAYEPIWAIGTGKACQPVQAQVINLLIRKILSGLYGRNIAKEMKVLYGGSVKQNNALGYLKETEMVGLLIGGASLHPKEFIRIVKDSSRI